MAKTAFPLAKAVLFHSNWPPLAEKVVSTCPATSSANVNGPEPLAIAAGSARAVRELLTIWPWALTPNRLDSWQIGVDSTVPKASMTAKLVTNCRLMRVGNTIWMINVICMFGFGGLVEGKVPVELGEVGVVDGLREDVDSGVVNGFVLARLGMIEDDEVVEGVLGIPESEVGAVEELWPPMPADGEVAKAEVLVVSKADIDETSGLVKDGGTLEESEGPWLNVGAEVVELVVLA